VGRKQPNTFSTDWKPPAYTVDERGKVVGGYTPTGVNNWGRWGEDDVRGTANLITPEVIVRAAGLVRRGEVFSLGLPLAEDTPRFPARPPAKHYLTQTGSDAVVGSPTSTGDLHGFVSNDDAIDLPLQNATQWDGLAHVQTHDTFYNGWWAGNVTAAQGASIMGIGHMRESFIGRGVLLDLAGHAGVDSLEPGFVIPPDMLDEVIAAQGVELRAGDMLLLRTGYLSRWWDLESVEDKAAYFSDGEPGIGQGSIGWLAGKDLAAIACDTVGLEVLPGEPDEARKLPVHQALLVDLGLTIGELWDLDRLAEDCREDRVWEFLLVAPPMYIPRAIASAINPVAIK
jgi:kynurenine formamidase